ncbi:hypothetical protein [Bacillus sp. ISL-45]|jgi:predicted XRE-type DNA-binding protein|uniref:hypothetical protein n=1 Tax=Bacillus sp. ISL-45 TaxID=2819128 RepID=UPI001BECE8D7|nr:hypothetical protein [Bacillus sp. ISL-45]MBT2663854.1 hypothetical protein [Bacillus sp. ISL-45]
MVQQRNFDLKLQIKKANLYLWQVAEEMQIHENTLYRLLRHNLSDAQKDRILKAIENLKEM